jgi:hypothetical protein
MTSASKRKGTKAELEVVALYRDHLGLDVRRTLAGHADDQGDLIVPSTTVQVKNFADVLRAIREGLPELARQQASTGHPFGVLWVRRRGGLWMAIQTPVQHFALWREANA